MISKTHKLKPKEISVRVGRISPGGVNLLLYVETRACMAIMDEMYGATNWYRTHKEVNGELFCSVSVYDEQKDLWIAREDVGTSGQYEKEKSRASDSFKRACVNWGVGRELYSSPNIFIPKHDDNCIIKPKKNDDQKLECHSLFFVNKISYDDNGKITALQIISTDKHMANMAIVYKYYPNKFINQDKINTLNKYFSVLGETRKNEVFETCCVNSIEKLTDMDFIGIAGRLDKEYNDKKG